MKQQTSLQKRFKKCHANQAYLEHYIQLFVILNQKMDQVYLDNVKSISSNKRWVDIDISGRILHTLKHKIQNIQWT